MAALGMSAADVDDLMCSIEGGAVAGVWSSVAELAEDVPGGHGREFESAWMAGAGAVTSALVDAADLLYRQRGRAEAFGLVVRRPVARPVEVDGPVAVTPELFSPVPELFSPVLEVAERYYTELSGRECRSPEDSREVLVVALGAMRQSETGGYVERLEEFVQANRARFERLYRVYGAGGLCPDGVCDLAAWPESIVLCERIESVPMWLDGLWGAAGCSEYQLERLSVAWRFGTTKER